jgi:hypothetical protein
MFLTFAYCKGFFYAINLRKLKNQKMKIEYNTIIAIVIALVLFKLLDKFLLDKVTNKLEEVIG